MIMIMPDTATARPDDWIIKTGDVLVECLGIKQVVAHAALDDIRATVQIARALLTVTEEGEPNAAT